MQKRNKILIVGGSVLALAAGGAGVAVATGSGDDGPGQPITGSALEQAKAAALQATGGGQVTATEVRDEEGYYEVEVQTTDGGQVDVHLNKDFSLVDSSADEDGTGADDGSGG
jgi:peptidase YpeB-like protein